MSENKIQNEEELWNVLDGTAPTAPKAEPKAESKPAKAEAKFAKPGAPKGKVDSFFLTCMAGVAAVSVAVTLLVTSLVGGEPSKPGVSATEPNPGISGEVDPGVSGEVTPGIEGDNEVVSALELENAELRAQVELQKDQIRKLQAELLDLSAGSEEMPTLATDPDGDNELVNEQLEAYEIFNQIKEAYTDFDRAKLEELVPEMDKRLSYLSNDALNEYYLILEYVEQPSNG
ncbi:MAG: hypothetical protein IJA49_06795 [Oscillospiraceae bacterium]|nr:hypothetical protein [Oscillospiraceae bacterium]